MSRFETKKRKRRSIFKNLPAVPNDNRPDSKKHWAITYVWLTQPDGSDFFRRAW